MTKIIENEAELEALFTDVFQKADSGIVKIQDVEFTFRIDLGRWHRKLIEAHVNWVIFSVCTFCKGVVCRSVDFSSHIFTFARCIFEQTTDFTNSRIREASFEKSLFRDTASFIGARFEEIIFNNVEFVGIVLLKGAIFPAKTKFYDVKFCGTVELAGFQCEELTFERCKIYGAMEFTDSKHSKIEFHALALPETKISGFFDLKWEEYGVKDMINRAQEDPLAIAKQFAVLKEVYHQIGDYDAEDEAFIAYMDSRARGGNAFKRSSYAVLKWVGGYGTKPLRIAVTMLLLILVSIGIYAIASVAPISGIVGWKNVFVTGLFGAIGMKTFENMHWAVILYGFLESVCGLFLFSYFSVALVRRTLR